MLRQKLLAIVKALAAPNDELVINCWLSEIHIDSIELIDNKTDFQLNVWVDNLEWQISSDELTKQELLQLIDLLQKILCN